MSQLAYEGTGVAQYLKSLIEALLESDKENQYVLFFSSMRKSMEYKVWSIKYKNVEIKTFKIPPTLLDLLWNKLHIFPIERFIGDVDVFISSDWTQPPSRKAKMATILYDLIVYKYPQETAKKIVETQKRKLKRIKECAAVLCISEATKKDAIEILGIDEKRLKVVYPGLTL